MADLFKVQAVLTGFSGAPGVNTFYVDTDPTDVNAFRTLYNDLAAAFPAGMSIQVQNSGVVIEETTGALTGAWTSAAVAAVSGTGEGQHVGGAGATVRWETGLIVAGRRLCGRTYLVPLTRGNYGTDGKLTSGAVTAFNTAANSFVVNCSGTLKVWSRPFEGKAATETTPERAAREGSSADVTGYFIPPKAALLASRRD